MGDTHRTAILGGGRLFRDALQCVLQNTPYHVIMSTEDVAGLSVEGGCSHIDLVLITNCFDAACLESKTQELHRIIKPKKIVVIADKLEENPFILALRRGVNGYILSNLSSGALIQSLNLVMAGESVFPSDLSEMLPVLACGGIKEPPQLGRMNGLSEDDGQIIALLAEGASNKEIAERLNLSIPSIKVRVKSLLRRLNMSNRTQAAVWARTRVPSRPTPSVGLWKERAHAEALTRLRRLPLRPTHDGIGCRM